MKYLLKKINNCILLLTGYFLFSPLLALADVGNAGAAASMETEKMFRHELLTSISDAFLSNSVFDWNTGFTKGLFAICTAIAFFQIIYRSYGQGSFLVNWAKTIVAMLIGLSILGGVDYRRFFPVNLNVPGIRLGTPTLDKAVFFYISNQFDKLADAFEATGGPTAYQSAMFKLVDNMTRLEFSLVQCSASSAGCIDTAMAAMKTTFNDAPIQGDRVAGAKTNQIDPSKAQQEEKGSFFSSFGGAELGLLSKILSGLQMFIMQIYPIPFILLKIAVYVLNAFRSFINYFTLITYALITSISLLFCKALTPFIVLPDFRGKIWNCYKIPLSATMYGFLTSFITAMSTVIINGINKATVTVMLNKATQGGMDISGTINMLFADSMAVCAILVIQVQAMSKVPGLAKNIWNLSLSEVVDFGKTIIEAGFGAMKALGGAAVAVGAAVATGGASAAVMGAKGLAGAAGAIKAGGAGGIGAAASSLGSGIGGGIKSGFSSAGRSLGKSAFGGNGNPMSGLSGLISGDGVGGGGPSGGGGTSGSPSSGGSDSSGGGGSSGPSGGGSFGGGGSGMASSGRMLGDSTTKKQKKSEDGGDSGGLNLTPKEKSLNEDPNRIQRESLKNSKNIRSFAGNLASMGLKTAGGLAMTGVGVALGKEANFADHFSHEGFQSVAHGLGSAVKGSVQANKEKKESSRQNMMNFSDSITEKMPQEEINVEEVNELAGTIDSGTGTSEDFSRLNKLTGNGNIGALPKETQQKIQKAKGQSHYAKWDSIRQAENKKALDSSITHSISGKASIDYNSPGLQEVQARVKDGRMTSSDLASDEKVGEDFHKLISQSKQDMINHSTETDAKVFKLRKKAKNSEDLEKVERLKSHGDNIKKKVAAHSFKNEESIKFYTKNQYGGNVSLSPENSTEEKSNSQTKESSTIDEEDTKAKIE